MLRFAVEREHVKTRGESFNLLPVLDRLGGAAIEVCRPTRLIKRGLLSGDPLHRLKIATAGMVFDTIKEPNWKSTPLDGYVSSVSMVLNTILVCMV